MRFFTIAFAVIAAVGASSTPPADYLPPIADNNLPSQEYLAPAVHASNEQTVLADDGYRYKAVHRLKLRHRRDVNELPVNEYLAPAANAGESLITEVAEHMPEVETQLADDGYRYKVVRRLKYRHRRDVNELPQNEYLPPNQGSEDTTVVEAVAPVAQVETQLADDGYRYKVVRRLKYRHRRDVNELPQASYLAPVASNDPPQNEYLPPVAEVHAADSVLSSQSVSEPETQLGNDGYRYKVVRRLKYRHRRDVNELPQTSYLAPAASNDLPQNEYLPPVAEVQAAPSALSAEPAAEPETQLANDGYRYKVVRRLKYRHRRDVNELPQTSYLAPAASSDLPQNEYLPPVAEVQAAPSVLSAEPAAEPETQLANDGYRYKVVRRLKYRHRRDVSELPQASYLAPAASNDLPQNEYLPPVAEVQAAPSVLSAEPAAEPDTQLGNDGYRYKVVRRLKYRHRRDVNELPQTSYLAPAASSDLPQNEYLPPVAEVQAAPSVLSAEPAAEPETQLANDGYRYKVIRRLKYRHRRDVNELPPQNEYLPPVVETAVSQVAEPTTSDATVLSNDGYRYKVVRRLKYRQRRDVNDLPVANEYLPPGGLAQGQELTPAVGEQYQQQPDVAAAVLSNDGYQYKTVRRLKYRRH